MKTLDEKTRNEKLSQLALINAKKSHENVELRSIDSMQNIPREERKKAASKPLYLARYE